METGCRGGVGVGIGLEDSGDIAFCHGHEDQEEEAKDRITLLEDVGGHGSDDLQLELVCRVVGGWRVDGRRVERSTRTRVSCAREVPRDMDN